MAQTYWFRFRQSTKIFRKRIDFNLSKMCCRKQSPTPEELLPLFLHMCSFPWNIFLVFCCCCINWLELHSLVFLLPVSVSSSCSSFILALVKRRGRKWFAAVYIGMSSNRCCILRKNNHEHLSCTKYYIQSPTCPQTEGRRSYTTRIT